jgi:hypothetical protein
MKEMFSKHLSLEVIADLVEGRLSADANGRATSHLASCSDCTKRVSELDKVVGLMRSDRMEDAPANVLQRAFGIMPRKVAVETPTLIQKIVAALSFDSATFAPAYGVRSGAASQSRQMIFNAGERDVDLRITSHGNEWVIAGQILGCAEGHVELKGENVSHKAELNELCEFRLPPVKSGSYKLNLVFEDAEIELPEIVVK